MVLENTKPYAMLDPKSKSLNLWPKLETKAVKHHNFGAKFPGLSRNVWLVWDEVKKIVSTLKRFLAHTPLSASDLKFI